MWHHCSRNRVVLKNQSFLWDWFSYDNVWHWWPEKISNTNCTADLCCLFKLGITLYQRRWGSTVWCGLLSLDQILTSFWSEVRSESSFHSATPAREENVLLIERFICSVHLSMIEMLSPLLHVKHFHSVRRKLQDAVQLIRKFKMHDLKSTSKIIRRQPTPQIKQKFTHIRWWWDCGFQYKCRQNTKWCCFLKILVFHQVLTFLGG